MEYHPKQIGNEKNRFALIQEGKRTLFVIGLNPSTADAKKPDPTMKATLRIAEYNGYDGFVMLNLYPLRATEPKDLPREVDLKLHEQNLQEIDNLLKERKDVDVWVAFGANVKRRKYLLICFKDIVKHFQKNNVHWYYINKLTKDAYPPHPLYQKTDLLKKLEIEMILSSNLHDYSS